MFGFIRRGGGLRGYSHIKWVCMCRPRLKRRGLTEKVGAFRAERMVKVVPLELIELGKNGCIQKKWVLLEPINLKK